MNAKITYPRSDLFWAAYLAALIWYILFYLKTIYGLADDLI